MGGDLRGVAPAHQLDFGKLSRQPLMLGSVTDHLQGSAGDAGRSRQIHDTLFRIEPAHKADKPVAFRGNPFARQKVDRVTQDADPVRRYARAVKEWGHVAMNQ